MKFSIIIFAVVFSMTLSHSVNAQKAVKLDFQVSAVCSMCEERIEKALDVKGIKMADYNLENGHLEVVYNPKVLSEEQVHQIVADAGHDTEKIKASDEVYNALHDCCKYRENSVKKCED